MAGIYGLLLDIRVANMGGVKEGQFFLLLDTCVTECGGVRATLSDARC